MGKRGKPLSQSEIQYIRLNCLTKTDDEIAKELGRDARTVVLNRKRLGIKKKSRGAVMNIEKPINANYDIASKKLTETQKTEFFKTILANSLYYKQLKEQYTKEELQFYEEEWGGLCVQFEDILATEKRQIDEYIKAEIHGNRMLRNIKMLEDEIELIFKEIEKLRKHHDMQNDEEAQERDFQLQMLTKTMTSQSQGITRDYQENVKLRNSILAELNGRRKDRIDQISKRGTTFLSVIEAFRDKEIRDAHGRQMELVKLAKDKKKEEWSKPVLFADGTKDCILMDENAKINFRDGQEVFSSEIIDKYLSKSGCKILIIDDDESRQQIFQQLFKGHDLSFASNADKAKAQLDKEYDLIMFDYDLGLGQKSDAVVDYIYEQKRDIKSDFVLHTMNKDGMDILFQKLNSITDSLDVCSFEDILENYGKKD